MRICCTFSLMPNLTLSVRIAAASILLLSVLHVLFWAVLAFAIRSISPPYPESLLFPVGCLFSAVGTLGVGVGVALFRVRPWARVAALVLAALVGLFCAFAILVVIGLLLVSGSTADFSLHRADFIGFLLTYFVAFSIAVWWIALFSRQKVALQFSSGSYSAPRTTRVLACPPPIALLAWLMIISAGLSALSWPLILGRIPVMLFTHVFSMASSKWIWAANVVLFLICGIGLLKLQRWSYAGAIALHIFWLVSMFVSQMSPLYEAYLRLCLNTIEITETYPELSLPRFSPWLTAIVSAIPTALLVAGLFYYRRSFLKAADDSHQPTS